MLEHGAERGARVRHEVRRLAREAIVVAMIAIPVGCDPAVLPARLPDPIEVPSFDPAPSGLATEPTPRIIVVRPTPIIIDDDDDPDGLDDDPDDGD